MKLRCQNLLRYLVVLTSAGLLWCFCGCYSLPPETKEKNEPEAFSKGLKTLKGNLWDVAGGTLLGQYQFKRDGEFFSIKIQTEKTRGKNSEGEFISYAACEGYFSGLIKSREKTFFIFGCDEYDSYYVLIHPIEEKKLPPVLLGKVQLSEAFLVTVTDKAVFEEINSSGENPVVAIESMKKFIRTQALLIQ